MHFQRAFPKSGGRSPQLKPPHPHESFVEFLKHRRRDALEAFRPMVERQAVMRGEILDIPNTEIPRRQMRDNFGKRRNIAAGENVFFDPTVNRSFLNAGNQMQQSQTVQLEQFHYRLDKPREIFFADMLNHPDTDDFVELFAFIGQHTVVSQPHARRILQAAFFDCRVRAGVLFLAERNAGRIRVVMLGGSYHERTPAAADVEQSLAGLQPQFSK